jgi:uncharacterized membrane protein HdeD (DUF308 family)
MKWISVIKTTLACELIAGWCRMVDSSLTWPNFPYLADKSLPVWLKAFWTTGVNEVLYFSWAYVLPIIFYLLTMKKLEKHNINKLYYLSIGFLYGGLGYLMSALFVGNLRGRQENFILTIIYSFVGLIFSIIYLSNRNKNSSYLSGLK